jgi:alkylated DNA repair dioxygenase AlkB
VDLFPDIRRLKLTDAVVEYHPAPQLAQSADNLFEDLRQSTPWAQHSVLIRETLIPQPRLSAWHGDVVHTYATLAHVLVPHPWTDVLQALRQHVEALAGARFNSVLANLYRSGDDCIGWHSDDEPELGREPVIASLSLGAERRFDLRRKDDHSIVKSLVLEHGSLLIMSGRTQQCWQHAIARTRYATDERINLTFRLTQPLSDGTR